MALLGCQWLGPDPQSQLDVQQTSGHEVHLVLDACHVLKLARNALAELKIMRDGEGKSIKWEHICRTLSSSGADAIEFLMNYGIPGFEDASGTVSFIRMVDRLFDFLNSRSRFSKGYKQPVSLNSLPFWAEVVETSINYLKQLRAPAGTLMMYHPRKAFILGFILSS